MANKVLFVLKYRENSWCDDYSYSGSPLHSGLYNSARYVVDLLNDSGIETKLVHCIDSNFIHREAVAFGATVVVIEAFWAPPSKLEELRKVLPHVKFIIRNHSEMPFLSGEGIAIDWSLRYLEVENVFIACNSLRATEQMKSLSTAKFGYPKGIIYLPNFYPIDKVKMKTDRFTGDVLNIACFGAIRPLKNQLQQAIAAIEFAQWLKKPMNFHINGSRIEMGGAPILKNLQLLFAQFEEYKLVEHSWNPEYAKTIAKMDLGMQVSFSETFNIVSSDFLAQGIPCVTSAEIFWNEPLLHADPTNPADILNKMKRAYYMSRNCSWFNRSLKGLQKYNKASKDIWVDYFS